MSDLAKYSITRSVERSLCDSWASCRDKARYWSKIVIFPLHSTPHCSYRGVAVGILPPSLVWKN